MPLYRRQEQAFWLILTKVTHYPCKIFCNTSYQGYLKHPKNPFIKKNPEVSLLGIALGPHFTYIPKQYNPLSSPMYMKRVLRYDENEMATKLPPLPKIDVPEECLLSPASRSKDHSDNDDVTITS